MPGNNNHAPPLGSLLKRLTRTAFGALYTRAELFAVEWQEERTRLTELLFWGVGTVFLAMLGLLLLTVTIILLFPAHLRLYVALAFTALYWLGALAAWFGLKSVLRREPFPDTLNQTRKDVEWLDSLK